MTPYYLKAETEEQLWTTLHDMGMADLIINEATNEEQWVFFGSSPDDRLFIIGEIQKPTGQKIVFENGVEVDEMAPVNGFHANFYSMRTDIVFENIEVVTPTTPHMVLG